MNLSSKRVVIPFTLICGFISFVLALCGMLAGKTGMINYHVLSFNTSHIGEDLLRNTDFFNFDETSLFYTLLFTNDTAVPVIGNANQINDGGGKGTKQARRRALDARDRMTSVESLDSANATLLYKHQQSAHAAQEQIKLITSRDVQTANPPAPSNVGLGVAFAISRFRSMLDDTIGNMMNNLGRTIQSIALDINNASSTNMPVKIIHATGPSFSHALRKYSNDRVNGGLKYFKEGFHVHDFYSVYFTQFCFGDGPAGAKQLRRCLNVKDLHGANLAPRIERMLRAAGSNRHVPSTLKLARGIERSIAGLVTFNQLAFAIDALAVIFPGLSFMATLISLVMPAAAEKITDWVCIFLHLISLGILAILGCFALLLVLGFKIVLGGIFSTFTIVNDPGWKFVTLHVIAIVLMAIAFLLWLWVGVRNSNERALRRYREKAESLDESPSRPLVNDVQEK